MNSPRLRILINVALLASATAAVATPSCDAFTLVTEPAGSYIPSANPPSDPEVVTLFPDPVVPIGTESVNLQTLLTDFNNGFYSGTGANAGNGHSINFNPTPLNGNLYVIDYQALSAGEDKGSAHMEARYFPRPGDPPLANVQFIQMVTTNALSTGVVTPYSSNGQRIDGSSTTDAFYTDASDHVDGAYLRFSDYPSRNCRAPHYPGESNIRWAGSLLLSSYDGTTLNVYTGFLWGWRMTCPAALGRPADVQRLSSALFTPGDNYVAKTDSPIEYTVVPAVGPSAQISLTEAKLTNLANMSMSQNGADEVYTLLVSLTGQMSANGGQPTPVQLQGQVQIEVFTRTGEAEGEFSTQMLAMDLTGTGDLPGYGPVAMTLRQSPTLTSTGSAEDVGELGIDRSETLITDGTSPFSISSFFDIFTELSINGGDFAPSQAGSMEFDLVPEPPTLVILLTSIVATLFRRRAVV